MVINMDDTVKQSEKTCTFLFKKRKIHSTATRQRKEVSGSDGKSLEILIQMSLINTIYIIYLNFDLFIFFYTG